MTKFEEWVDRNSLGLDRTSEVRALKPRSKQLMDAVRWRLNEHIDVPQRDIYEPGMDIRNFLKLVPLEYKDAYIAQKKANIFHFLGNLSLKRKVERKVDNTSATGEKWVSESWEEYFHSLSSDPAFLDLRDYHAITHIDKKDGRMKKLVTDEEILETIEQCLIKESAETLKFLLDKDPVQGSVGHNLSETRQAILAWALINELFEPDVIDQIDFDDESFDSLIEKYRNNIEYEIFDAIVEEIKPQEAKKHEKKDFSETQSFFDGRSFW